MKRKIKSISALAAIVLLLITQVITASARTKDYDSAYNMDKDELYEAVWDCYADSALVRASTENGDYDDVTAFSASMARYELSLFLEDYEVKNSDIKVFRVKNDFASALSEKYEDITIDKDDDDNIYQINADGSRYDWTYDSASDMFKAYDEDGEYVMSYDRYHAEGATTSTSSGSGSSSGSSSSSNKSFAAQSVTNPSNTSNSASSTVKSSTTATATADEATVDETKVEAVAATTATATADSVDGTSGGLSTVQMIVIGCVGVAAVIGACVAGKFAGKKKG